MKVAIVGGGIIGAALARFLRDAGAEVTVLDTGSGATAASFGWLNASFYQGTHHFRLRAAGLEAWKRLGGQVNWSGCLCWEEEGAAFDTQKQTLAGLGYSVEEVDAATFASLEPHVVPPSRALLFASEGVAEPQIVTNRLLGGVRCIVGVPVEAIRERAGRATGVVTAQGTVPADRVIVAAGIGSPGLLRTVGISLPMLDRPGVIMRTAPVPPLLSHILAAPGQEMRQDKAGHIWAPTSAHHQSDDSEVIDTRPDRLADHALKRVQEHLPGQKLSWDRVIQAHRPVPNDGLPVISACGPEGLFAAVMHSGVTLAAITAELLGPQILGKTLTNTQANLVAPYTVSRFQS